MSFAFKVLGQATLSGPDGPATGPAVQRHRLALLTILAMCHPRAVSREKLTALLWPESDDEHARALLSQSVYVLRRCMGDPAILSEHHEVGLGAEIVACDVIAFRAAVDACDLEGAIELYGGPLLDGFFLPDNVEFDHWLERERSRLDDTWMRSVEALADDAERRGDNGKAVRWWRVLSSRDPYDSRIAVRLMKALDGNGNPVGALRHGTEHARLLLEDFGVQPPPAVQALADEIKGRGAPHPHGASSS